MAMIGAIVLASREVLPNEKEETTTNNENNELLNNSKKAVLIDQPND